MVRRLIPGLLLAAFMWSTASAGDLTTDAAIGGAVGGAVGGVIGAELGGREGAIVGAGVGAVAGATISTSDHADEATPPPQDYGHTHGHHAPPQGRFCPPGQAKKGRC